LQDKADAAGLPRTVRALAVASAVTVLFFFGSWSQSFIGFFVAATYWRTLLVPKEVSVCLLSSIQLIHNTSGLLLAAACRCGWSSCDCVGVHQPAAAICVCDTWCIGM
jgi:hypothetical protein